MDRFSPHAPLLHDEERARLLTACRPEVSQAPDPPSHAPETPSGTPPRILGMISSLPMPVSHLLPPTGPGDGACTFSGLVAIGLDAEQMGVPADVLATHALLQVVYLDPQARGAVETQHLLTSLDVHTSYALASVTRPRSVGLAERLPTVWRYFVRVKPEVLADFRLIHRLGGIDARDLEDEFLFQNCLRLNQVFYSTPSPPRAMVWCHGRDLLLMKAPASLSAMLGYYEMSGLKAHLLVTQEQERADRSLGMTPPHTAVHEAVVCGDAVDAGRARVEALRARRVVPVFGAEGERASLLLDTRRRCEGYLLDHVLEMIGPLAASDLAVLPPTRRTLAGQLRTLGACATPETRGPIVVARRDPHGAALQLVGLSAPSGTETLVYAQYHGEIEWGAIASRRDLLDAALASLHREDRRYCPKADRTWEMRGGSAIDGGGATFTLMPSTEGLRITTVDRLGNEIRPGPRSSRRRESTPAAPGFDDAWRTAACARQAFALLRPRLEDVEHTDVLRILESIRAVASRGLAQHDFGLGVLSLLLDRRFSVGGKKRSWLLADLDHAVLHLLDASPHPRICDPAEELPLPAGHATRLVIDGREFARSGSGSLAAAVEAAGLAGWTHLTCYGLHGHENVAAGLVSAPGRRRRIDLFGMPGPGLGRDAADVDIEVHEDVGSQAGAGLSRARLVIHGDAGADLARNAADVDLFVLGQAGLRACAESRGAIRAVLNGPCLGELGAATGATTPACAGWTVVLNGIVWDERGDFVDADPPFSGPRLLAPPPGGVLYLRDPERRVDAVPLVNAVYAPFTAADGQCLERLLAANEQCFGISADRLLGAAGHGRSADQVYRKIVPAGSVPKPGAGDSPVA